MAGFARVGIAGVGRVGDKQSPGGPGSYRQRTKLGGRGRAGKSGSSGGSSGDSLLIFLEFQLTKTGSEGARPSGRCALRSDWGRGCRWRCSPGRASPVRGGRGTSNRPGGRAPADNARSPEGVVKGGSPASGAMSPQFPAIGRDAPLPLPGRKFFRAQARPVGGIPWWPMASEPGARFTGRPLSGDRP